DALSNQLAHRLRHLGVRPGHVVALCVERSPLLFAGMLAILKAGAAYLPLDPEHPAERLGFMLRDARVPVLLTRSHLAGSLAEPEVQTLCLDTDWEGALANESTAPLHDTGDAEELAYVIYTSGSTGTPKGIGVPHRAVLRLVCNTDYVRLEPSDRVAQAANSSFDAATFEIWGPLLHGATVVGISKEVALSPRELEQAIREHGITTLFVTTALFNQLARETPAAFQPLRHLLFGGEAVDPKWVRAVLDKGAPGRLLHVYGPTETTTFASWHLTRHVSLDATTVPIGQPLANTTLHVLDERLRAVPVGLPGELFIGGPGVARGYLGRPALTAERFIPDPFAGEPGARMYRTGDLVRRLADGAIEFQGRRDHQVKLRGFRIELGEIESALVRHPEVGEAVLLVREDAPGDKRLVAYVVAHAGASPSAASLRGFLADQLPAYMVPSAIVLLESLPLNANGKVDRRALPAPTFELPHAIVPSVTRTPVEELVAGVWADVLGLPGVGLDENFFDLGGHSLLATQVVARLREALRTELSIRDFFEAPTLGAVVRKLEAALAADPGHAPPPLHPAPRTDWMPQSFAQERLWLLAQLDAESSAYHVPLALRLSGALKEEALRLALEGLVHRHEALRTVFAPGEDGPLQQVLSASPLPLTTLSVEALPQEAREAEALRLARQEAQRPFDLAKGPLVRALLVRLGPDDAVLLLVLHHIVTDGWSMGVLVRELGALYAAHVSGQPPALPPLPVQYADYAQWQRQWL
ncbi:non-ribosomal peptide synthetase, partial [Corallococcus sp. AS-1-6]|uniref:non-ribosomal peptide synthetase n=1 Tax=Corallococcus sp. AS-1-6 TaxID=2874599 RepID=UPI001CBBAE33